MNVVVVAPHPDDEIIGVGGTIAKHCRNGDNVYVVVVTKGAVGFYDEDYVEEGRRQQREADAVLGVKDIIHLCLPTPLLDTIPYSKIEKSIQDTLLSIDPKVVYVPHYGDMHFEHRLVAECCMVALRPKKFDDLEIFGYEVPSETGWNAPVQQNEFVPNMYVRLDEVDFKKKVQALNMFSSQMNEYPSARSVRAIENLARYRGATVGTETAEAFMLIRGQRS